MQIETIVVGPLQTNCYVISKNEECLIIDPGEEANKIIETVANRKVVGCFLTHSHFDHIGALQTILEKYNLEVNKKYSDTFIFDTIKTPGHTTDSVTYYFKEEKIMFTGDFLFKDAIGRTDLGGNEIAMLQSIRKIIDYPSDIKIYPGHGPSTFLGKEKGNLNFL